MESVATGTAPAASKDPEEEWRKRITSILMEGQPLVIIDNFPTERVFDSVSLAAAVTSPEWTDRRLAGR
jgi:hypothetical protein